MKAENLERISTRIRLLPVPTYAPWTNPIEKFWLRLNREFMKQHPYALDHDAFLAALDAWLDKHREESAALLHEVGLLPDTWMTIRINLLTCIIWPLLDDVAMEHYNTLKEAKNVPL